MSFLMVAAAGNGLYALLATIAWIRGEKPDDHDRLAAIIGGLTLMLFAMELAGK